MTTLLPTIDTMKKEWPDLKIHSIFAVSPNSNFDFLDVTVGVEESIRFHKDISPLVRICKIKLAYPKANFLKLSLATRNSYVFNVILRRWSRTWYIKIW